MPTPKVFSCFQSTGWRKENCHGIWQHEGCWGATTVSQLGLHEPDTCVEKVTLCQACPLWQRSLEADPWCMWHDLQSLLQNQAWTPHGCIISLLRLHHHYTIHTAVYKLGRSWNENLRNLMWTEVMASWSLSTNYILLSPSHYFVIWQPFAGVILCCETPPNFFLQSCLH